MSFCGVNSKCSTRRVEKVGLNRRLVVFLDFSSVTKFLRFLGARVMRMLEEVIKATLISERQICPRSRFVDTTAQPENIEYPTDAAVLNNRQQRLVRTIRCLEEQGVELGRGARSFHRLNKRVMVQIPKFCEDQKQRIEQCLKELIKYAQGVVKRVPQHIPQESRQKPPMD